MNSFNNPFGQDQAASINIDKLAEEMAETLKKLSENKDKPNFSQISDNSLGSVAFRVQHIGENDGNIQSMRRENPIKITAVPKKRKTNSQYQNIMNQDSQYIDSMSNRKITEYLVDKKMVQPKPNPNTDLRPPTNPTTNPNMKSISSNDESQPEVANPIVRTLRDKIERKKKSIEQLQAVHIRIRQKGERLDQQIKSKKSTQVGILIDFMSQKYSQKIYKHGIKNIRATSSEGQESTGRQLLGQLMQKIEYLKNEKTCKKNNKNKTQESNLMLLEVYGEQKQVYMHHWKKRLQAQKTALQKQLIKTPTWSSVQLISQQYLQLPEIFLTQAQQRKIFQKQYLPLYCRHYDQNSYFYQIRALNLEKLWYENLLVLHYPKLMKNQRRMEIKLHLKNIHQKSVVLNQDFFHSAFINNTIFTQIQRISLQAIVLGRLVWEEDLPNITLRNIIRRYEVIPEAIAKHIIRGILRAHQRIRKQLNHEAIILPDNILFNDRNDFKIDNWTYNQVYKFRQFLELLIKDSKYLYFPPEYKISVYSEDHRVIGAPIWTAGVILYEMLFGKKPFNFSYQIVDYQQFYMMNDLSFPPKPQITQNCKQFLRHCLCKSQIRTTCEKALKHSFMQSKK